MQIASGSQGVYERGDEERFTGEVWLRSTIASPTGISLGIVHFAPGARTHWHAHPGGQFLYGVSGRGRVRSRNGDAFFLEPGDVIHVPAGEWHFHGGSPDAPVVHVAVNGNGSPDWGDAVSQEAYEDGF